MKQYANEMTIHKQTVNYAQDPTNETARSFHPFRCGAFNIFLRKNFFQGEIREFLIFGRGLGDILHASTLNLGKKSKCYVSCYVSVHGGSVKSLPAVGRLYSTVGCVES